MKYITTGNLPEIIKCIEDNHNYVNFANKYAISEAADYGHLEVIKYLSGRHGVDASAQDNLAIINAARKGHLSIVEYLSSLPGVDASAQDNWAIVQASILGHTQVVEYLLTLPKVNAFARDNWGLIMAYIAGRYKLLAMLLYSKPRIYVSLSNKEYNDYQDSLLSELRPIVHKISISLTELPTPILIELIEQSIDFGIYVPYHIKWNMVVAIKHSKYNDHNCEKK